MLIIASFNLNLLTVDYNGTSLLRTLLNLDFSPYYRGINSVVTQYTAVLHWDTEGCPYYRDFCNSEVYNREVPLYSTLFSTDQYFVYCLIVPN